jgi:hypothetical protein
VVKRVVGRDERGVDVRERAVHHVLLGPGVEDGRGEIEREHRVHLDVGDDAEARDGAALALVEGQAVLVVDHDDVLGPEPPHGIAVTVAHAEAERDAGGGHDVAVEPIELETGHRLRPVGVGVFFLLVLLVLSAGAREGEDQEHERAVAKRGHGAPNSVCVRCALGAEGAPNPYASGHPACHPRGGSSLVSVFTPCEHFRRGSAQSKLDPPGFEYLPRPEPTTPEGRPDRTKRSHR